MATAAALKTMRPPRRIIGTVVSAGKMAKTVTVRVSRQKWHTYLRKNFTQYSKVLVHDPNSSLLEGDVISLTPWRNGSQVKHTVEEILAPFGKPVEQRPPVPSLLERDTRYLEKKIVKLEKKENKQNILEKSKAQLEQIRLRFLLEQLKNTRALETQTLVKASKLLATLCESSRACNVDIAMETSAVVLDGVRMHLTNILAQPHRQEILYIDRLDAKVKPVGPDDSQVVKQLEQLKGARTSKKNLESEVSTILLGSASAGMDKVDALIAKWRESLENWKSSPLERLSPLPGGS